MFVCPRFSLKTYLDFNIAFSNGIVRTISTFYCNKNKIDNDDDDVVLTKVQLLHPRNRLRGAVAKMNRENGDDVIITKVQPVHPSDKLRRIVARMNTQKTTSFV